MKFLFRWSCLLLLAACNSNEPLKEVDAPVWSEHVAPIIYKNCSPCHRPGEAGGFSLLSYHDAVKRARLIRFVTTTRYMPPWPADPTYSHFINERVLTDKEIALISEWVEQGAQRGDSTREPGPPKFFRGSVFRRPDLVIRPQHPIKITGNGTDVFYVLKYPYKISRDTIVDFVEFVPNQRKLVHHVNGHLVSYDEKRQFNYETGSDQSTDDRSKMMTIYEQMHVPYVDGKSPQFPMLTPNTVYYLPGYEPPAYPNGIGGYYLRKNGLFLINNIHYGPSAIDTYDSSYINVFFRKDPVTRPVSESQLGTFGLSKIEPEFIIPANTIKTFTTSYRIPADISVLSLNPHMHLIGKTFLSFAVTPSGDTIPLIRINKWDFRWQYYYTFKNPVKLPSGSVIYAIGTFDNTSANPNNPFQPPRIITQGNGNESMKTSEEMFQLMYTFMPYQHGDEQLPLVK